MPKMRVARRRTPSITKRLAAGAALGTAVGVVGAMVERRWRAAPSPTGPGGLSMDDAQGSVRRLEVRTNDGALLATAVYTAGAPRTARTVVLSHCWMCSSTVWAPVAKRLLQAGHNVVLYDQRGHGRSSGGRDPISVERLGHDLAAVLEQTEVEDVVLAGHSMGGFSTMAYSVGHPDDLRQRVRALALVATAAHGMVRFPMPEFQAWLLGNPSVVGALGRGRSGLTIARQAFGSNPSYEHLRAVRDMVVATPSSIRADCYRAFIGMEMRDGLTKVDTPAVVVGGQRDILTPPRLGRAAAMALPSGRFELWPEVGHMLPMEAPDRVADVILSLT